MSEKHENFTPPQEGKKQSNLDRVFQILNTDAIEGQQMMCQRMGNILSFYTLFASEQAAKIAHNQLVQMGNESKLEGRKIFLTAEFPGDEIDKLADTFTSIPKRKK